MKKLLVIIFVVTFFSCEKDEVEATVSSDEPQNYVLPKKISLFGENGELRDEYTYEYDGNKPVKFYSKGKLIIEYIYEGEKVISVNLYDTKGEKSTDVVSYENGNISKYILANKKVGVAYVFEQNELKYKKTISTSDEINWRTIDSTMYRYRNNNIINVSYISDPMASYSNDFVFDEMNNPFKNCNEFSKYFLYNLSNINCLNQNNIKEKKQDNSIGFINEIKYDVNNYPIEIKSITDQKYGQIQLYLETTVKIEYLINN